MGGRSITALPSLRDVPVFVLIKYSLTRKRTQYIYHLAEYFR